MKAAIFRDERIQKQFEQDGFVKLKLFDENEFEQLRALYLSDFSDDKKYFFSSSTLDNYEKKREISDEIVKIISPKVADHFVNYRLIGGALLIKGTGDQSHMPMHQDWTIVDEEEFFAVNIWIPLTTTNEENGTLELMKGSHSWNNALRAPTLPMSFQGLEDQIKPCLTIVNAEPGEVVVLNQATIHYSKPNLTNKIRPAITSGLISADAPLKFYYWDKERSQIEEFWQEDDFLLAFENFTDAIYKRPLMGISKGYYDYEIPKMTESELLSHLNPSKEFKSPNVENKTSFFKRIFG